jgi:hypothetical protein
MFAISADVLPNEYLRCDDKLSLTKSDFNLATLNLSRR